MKRTEREINDSIYLVESLQETLKTDIFFGGSTTVTFGEGGTTVHIYIYRRDTMEGVFDDFVRDLTSFVNLYVKANRVMAEIADREER